MPSWSQAAAEAAAGAADVLSLIRFLCKVAMVAAEAQQASLLGSACLSHRAGRLASPSERAGLQEQVARAV
jgi:hypothetical protein